MKVFMKVVCVFPFRVPDIYGRGKRSILVASNCLPSAILQTFEFPHPFPFNLNNVVNFPLPRAKKPIHPLVFPNILPWLAQGHTPGGSVLDLHKRRIRTNAR